VPSRSSRTARRAGRPFAALAFAALGVVAVHAQAPTARTVAYLKHLFPESTTYSVKEGDPPAIKVYGPPDAKGQPTLLGLAFWTTEIEPLERGYEGPIKMIVGLTLKAQIAGLIVVEQHEPFGPISVLKPQFPANFKGKSIRDPFILGQDVDAISTATITMTSATRAIKKSARRVATRYLTPDGTLKTEAGQK